MSANEPENSPEDFDFEAELATHPHDAWFKQVFSHVPNARALFHQHLPPEISAGLDLEKLQILPSSFVRTTLQQSHSDLLFSVPSVSGSLLLYLLFEHQTTVAPAMPLRLLGYMTEIWTRHEKDLGLPLPPILPLVLHQGPDRWTASTSFHHLLSHDPALSDSLLPHLPSFRHLLLDLTQYQPATEEPNETLRIVLNLMKLAREKQRLLEFFSWLDQTTLQISMDLFSRCLLYALHSDQTIDFKDIYNTFEKRKELQDTTMSIAQKLRNEGRVEGRVEGRIQLLQDLMGEPVTPDAVLAPLSQAELQQMFEFLQQEYNRRHKP